jgi:uncharacterized protein (UPF0335 family)
MPSKNRVSNIPAADRSVARDDNAPDSDDAFDTTPTEVAGISAARLRSFIERIERVESEIRDLQADKKEIKAEAKGNGFDVKVINYLIKLRRQDADDLDEFETLVDLYRRAIGMAP